MDISREIPPRKFRVGQGRSVELSHTATLRLFADEQVTFVGDGTEFDVVRKDWGYYATPSLNHRLVEHGLRGALVIGLQTARVYVLLVATGMESAFQRYLEREELEILCWLDTQKAIERLRVRLWGD